MSDYSSDSSQIDLNDYKSFYGDTYWSIVLFSLIGFILFNKYLSPCISSRFFFTKKIYLRFSSRIQEEWSIR